MVASQSVPDGTRISQEPHRLRVVGYLHGRAGARRLRDSAVRVELPRSTVCDSPLLWACELGCCMAARPCGNHRESKCSPCSTRYRRRVSRLIEAGLSITKRKTGHLYLLTVNAPGDDGHQRWVPGRPGRHGLCGCHHARAEGDAAWNGSAGSRWNHLRTLLAGSVEALDYVRVVEVQRRGLIHLHVVLWSPKPLAAQAVQTMALAAGFGCVMDLAPLDSADKTARYLAKYVTKSVDVRGSVPWVRHHVDRATGEVESNYEPTFRAWSSSRSWPVRMADLVAASRRAVAIAAARQLEDAETAAGGPDANGTAPGNAAAPPT